MTNVIFIISLKTDMDPDTGEPLDTLTAATRSWAKSIGSKATTVTEVLTTQDPAVSTYIRA